MKQTQYRRKPEFILEHVNLKQKKKSGMEMPGFLRTFISVFLVISVFSGSAAVTAWLVFRESSRRKKQNSLLELTRKTDRDLKEIYLSAFSRLAENPDILGKSDSCWLMLRYLVYLSLGHGYPLSTNQKSKLKNLVNKTARIDAQLVLNILKVNNLIVLKKYKEAELLLEKLLIRYSRKDLLIFQMARARKETGRWDAALASMNMALELNDERPVPYLLELAELKFRKGQNKNALELLKTIDKRSPGHIGAKLFRKLIALKKGDRTKLSESKPKTPRFRSIYLYLQGYKQLTANNYDASYEFCHQSLENYFLPESRLCQGFSLLEGKGSIKQVAIIIKELEPFNLAQTQLLNAFYEIKRNQRVDNIDKIKVVTDYEKELLQIIKIYNSRFTENNKQLMNQCKNPTSTKICWNCIMAAVYLRHFQLLKTILPSLSPSHGELLNSWFFRHSITKAWQSQLPGDKCKGQKDGDFVLRYVSAQILLEAGLWKSALQLLHCNLKSSAQSVQARVDYLAALAETDNLLKASSQLYSLLQLQIKDPLTLFAIGYAAKKLSKFSSVEMVAERLENLNPGNPEALLLKGWVARK
nr:tetratricopeptide repeat protein [Deltaproteobacteria bacterium]